MGKVSFKNIQVVNLCTVTIVRDKSILVIMEKSFPIFREKGLEGTFMPDIVRTDYHYLPFHRVFIELSSKGLNLGVLK